MISRVTVVAAKRVLLSVLAGSAAVHELLWSVHFGSVSKLDERYPTST